MKISPKELIGQNQPAGHEVRYAYCMSAYEERGNKFSNSEKLHANFAPLNTPNFNNSLFRFYISIYEASLLFNNMQISYCEDTCQCSNFFSVCWGCNIRASSSSCLKCKENQYTEGEEDVCYLMTKCLQPAETAHSFLLADHLFSECQCWLEAVPACVHSGRIELQHSLAALVLSNLVISM